MFHFVQEVDIDWRLQNYIFTSCQEHNGFNAERALTEKWSIAGFTLWDDEKKNTVHSGGGKATNKVRRRPTCLDLHIYDVSFTGQLRTSTSGMFVGQTGRFLRQTKLSSRYF